MAAMVWQWPAHEGDGVRMCSCSWPAAGARRGWVPGDLLWPLVITGSHSLLATQRVTTLQWLPHTTCDAATKQLFLSTLLLLSTKLN